MIATLGPLTIGTAGHVDHGKTALVRALTGVDTDRLPEERERGLTIVLGYAPLRLSCGRQVSVVDVPGHERFVRTMVAGASGIDMFLMVLAADDSVMPQTIEHARVLRALGVRQGVVAVTKADLADPARATAEAEDLLPDCPVLACSARTGAGLPELTVQLEHLAARLPSRADLPGPTRLHVDRAFSVAGRGTVLTGTLWAGAICVGDALHLAQANRGVREVRVRGLQVHDHPVGRADAGQRVAVNLTGIRSREVARGDVLTAPGGAAEAMILDCSLELAGARHGERVHIHHGTRETPGRLCRLSEGLWQVRLQRPLLALAGDRVVARRLAPPDTLGGGIVLDAQASRHGPRPDIVRRLVQLSEGQPVEPHEAGPTLRVPREHAQRSQSPPVESDALEALENKLREAGTGMLSEAQLQDDRDALRWLRQQGRAVRVSGRLYAHAEVVAETCAEILSLLEREGSVTLAGVRDALGLSRKSSQAFLEHLDAARLTRRLADDQRVARRRGQRCERRRQA